MKKQNDLENCKNKISENHYSGFSNPKELKRIDGKYIISEIGSVLNFEKGILYTIKKLLIKPGITIRKFITEDRTRLVKPVFFIIICSLIYTVFRQLLHFKDDYLYFNNSNPSFTTTISIWIKNNYGYGNLIISVFIAFWTKLLFKKYKYNFYELLILLCYVMGIGMLILTVFGIIEGLIKLKVVQFGSMIFVIYYTWAIGQFFDKKKYINYFKAFLYFRFINIYNWNIIDRKFN
ncbi:DUF3667 domain-containing protein [Lutibacter citreus]|uniref:DUF3667 domain-containing protein n=1 Tax=Lutibacter citreus TaxID=2138210 RepID=UPI001FE38882|nr:DUF3667 domain-containing protein [Lutibacter citreus]